MNKKTLLVILAVAAVAGATYFLVKQQTKSGLTAPSPPPTNIGPVTVRIGYPALRIALPVWVAKEKGFFTKHNINAELVRYDNAQPMMEAIVGGSLDVGGYCALPITFSAMVKSKTPLIFITSMMEDDQHPISMLIVKKDSGLSSVKDLAGKRIGILPTLAYEKWLQKVLAANGVDPTSVVIQQIPPPQQVSALASGSVDALFTNDPAATAAIVKGTGEALLPGKAIVPTTTGVTPFYFGSFNVTKAFADANPDVVRRLSLALDEAIAFISENPTDAYKTMENENYIPKEQHGIIAKFSPSLYKNTADTRQADIDAALDYYKREGILAAKDLTATQYQR